MEIKTGNAKVGLEASISFKNLSTLVIVFLIGVLTVLVIGNKNPEILTSFKTLDLIGFTLSVFLSGASIILAFSAINLGKASELILMKRSDESIHLQNEVYIKTTEALNRIESSTGVTEKRIEDIISGRAGFISRQVAESAKQGADPKELEEQIKKSLRESLTIENTWGKIGAKDPEKVMREEAYQDGHAKVMLAFANKAGVKVVKMRQDGSPSSSGVGLFDGIFIFGETRIGVSTFPSLAQSMIIRTFVFNALEELAKKNISKIYLILFKKGNDELFQKTQAFLSTLQKDFRDKIMLMCDEPENLAQTIESEPF